MVRHRGSTQPPEVTSTWGATRTGAATITRVRATSRGPVASAVFSFRRGVQVAVGALRRAWGVARDVLTPAGWFLLTVVGGGLVLGVAAGWMAAWFVTVASVVLFVLGLPFLLGGHEYDVALEVDRDRTVAGREITGQVRVRNTGRRTSLPSTLDVAVAEGLVEAHVPALAPEAVHVEPLRIAAHRRGVIDVGPMTLVRSDPVGLLRREVTWDQRQTIYVHPETVTLMGSSAGVIRDLEGMPSSRVVSSDLAFHAIREYAAGDSRRNVHWKSTAKVGKLMVREYEETLRSRIAVLLSMDEQDYADPDEVELAVSVAASVAVQGVRQGRDTFVGVSQEAPRATRGRGLSMQSLPTVSVRTLLDATSMIQPASIATTLEDLASLASSANPQMSLAFVVTGSRPDLARLRAAALALPAGTTVVGLRCEPLAEPVGQSFAEVTVLTIGALQDLGHLIARRVSG